MFCLNVIKMCKINECFVDCNEEICKISICATENTLCIKMHGNI